MEYGRYQIIAELGRGSMGVVYKAHDPQIDRMIALKVLREDRVTSDDFVRRFLKEAMAVGRLSHPGIVTVYDVGQDHGSIYIAMEFLQGTPLDELMAQRKFTLEEIVDIGTQTASALHYAHQNGIVHRDIKPPNIIYSPEGAIRVTDFGIARIEDPNGHQMTQAGEILGTPLYMSPEQVTGQTLDGRSDIYSLGIILYQLTTGQRPFQGTTLTSIFRAITQDTPEAPHTVDPKIPVPLSDLIMKLLDKEPVKRFSSGDDLISALQGCLHPQSPAPKKSPDRLTREPKQGFGTRTVLISGLIGLIICIGLGGYYFLQQQPPSSPLSSDMDIQKTSPPPSAASATRTDTPQITTTPFQSSEQTDPVDSSVPIKPPLNQQKTKKPLGDKKTVQKQIKPDAGTKNTSTQVITSHSPDDSEKKIPSGKQTLLKMDSRPPGADLYIDGSRVGTTPVNLTIAAGKHEVKLKLDKHLGWEAQLDLSKGGEVPLSIQLLPDRTITP
jgi:serine/threonine-protein kinase